VCKPPLHLPRRHGRRRGNATKAEGSHGVDEESKVDRVTAERFITGMTVLVFRQNLERLSISAQHSPSVRRAVKVILDELDRAGAHKLGKILT
jgi:hypothetical protein